MRSDIDLEWEGYWKDIVTNFDGSLNLEELKKELYAYSIINERVQATYRIITEGEYCSPATDPEIIVAEWLFKIHQARQNVAKELTEDLAISFIQDHQVKDPKIRLGYNLAVKDIINHLLEKENGKQKRF